ncbi:WD40 repeat domain-containing protein [Sulfurimonas sp.]
MKQIILILLFTTSLFSFYLSNTLPKETMQIINSFDCFSKEDKIVLSTYVLALKYRMEHVDDKDALIKSDLDYWRFWHLVSDIQSECALHYNFDNYLEDTITSTVAEKNILKKLRRVEGSIRTDGSSESSERMRKYDAKLKGRLLSNIPTFKTLPKSDLLPDYDLTTEKKYKKNSIPKSLYNTINEMKITEIEKNILFRYALLKEERIRSYDKPKERKRIAQEIIYLEECEKYYDVYLEVKFNQNFKRKLINSSVSYSNFYPLKKEFLPKEVKDYCENNITKSKITTYSLKKEIKKQSAVKKPSIKLENLKKFLHQYKSDETKAKYAEQYFNLMKKQLEKKSTSTPNSESLKLLRLQNCLVGNDNKQDFLLIMARVKDFRLEGIKETFYKNIFNSQVWWKTTIKMKEDIEGKNKKLTHFFDCNQTSSNMLRTANRYKTNKRSMRSTETIASDMRMASSYVGDIFKYYAGTFEDKPTPNINNKKAIEAGLVTKKMLDKNGSLKTPFGRDIQIKGMPKGGMSLTFYDIPKGKLCSDFIMFGRNDNIYFNGKTYTGLDYILLNNNKIKIKHYVAKHVERLCAKKEKNIISFVKEETITKYNYRLNKSLDSAFSNVTKIKTFDTNKHSPYSYSYNHTKDTFSVIGGQSKLYSSQKQKLLSSLPKKFDNSYSQSYSPNGKYLAVGRYAKKIYIWDTEKNKVIKTIVDVPKEAGSLIMYLNDNKTILLGGQKLYFLDVNSKKVIGNIEPKFMKSARRFGWPRMTTFLESKDGKTFYIGSNVNKIERWNIEKTDSGQLNINYKDTIENNEIREVGCLSFHPTIKDLLIIASKNKKIVFMDIKNNKIIKTLISDEYMNSKEVQFSDDHNYMLVIGNAAVLWDLKTNTIIDIINGDKIIGGAFIPNTSNFITIGKDISSWKIN